ncbi:MAG: hypothetical protein AAGA33_12180 [Pseudomonadota bacterium]
MMSKAKQLIASFVTMAVLTIAGVILFFRPVSEADSAAGAWPAPLALAVYAGLSVWLMDWASQRTKNSYSAAFVVAGSQSILILDLAARGERGLLTAIAGIILVAITWTAVAFVHSRLTVKA